MGGGTRTKTAQEAQVPGYVQPLTQQTAAMSAQLQRDAPLQPFLQAKPMQIAGLSEKERRGGELLGSLDELGRRRVTGANLATSPAFAAAQEAFRTNIDPAIENQSVLGGLNRSTGLTNATAAARAQYLQPLIESELGREERGNQQELQTRLSQIQGLLGAGATERGIEQAGYEAQTADEARRQALAETALFQPQGQLLPSTFGQTSTTRGKQGIFTGG